MSRFFPIESLAKCEADHISRLIKDMIFEGLDLLTDYSGSDKIITRSINWKTRPIRTDVIEGVYYE